jgi:hypothetical protein
MFVKIELLSGRDKKEPTKHDIQKNIDALCRAIRGKKTGVDDILLADTKSILMGIQEKLPTK